MSRITGSPGGRPLARRSLAQRTAQSLRAVGALILREMSTRYGSSPGGYVWALLEPIGAILVLALGFSLIVNAPALGNSFILFYATGFLPFNLYQQVSLTVARAITFSRPLLFYPTVTWFDSVVARFVLSTLTGVMVSFLVAAILVFATQAHPVIEVWPILLGMMLAAVLGLGVGLLNCALMGLFPVWDVVWSIITRPLFIASGILFILEDLPHAIQKILWFNPLIHVIGILRSGFYPLYEASYASVTFVLLCAMIPGALGILLLDRYHRDILEKT